MPDLDALFPMRDLPSPWLHAPIWCGMSLGAWLSLLARNGFRVSPRYWPRALLASLAAPFNSLLGVYTHLIYRRRLQRVAVRAPLFVVGHWRSGTTLLHELLALDPRHAWPDGYACFVPAHFLRTRYLLRATIGRLVRGQRPMDQMAFDLALPQEDEFALLFLGACTPYETLGFPLTQDEVAARLDPALLSPGQQARFDRVLRRFYASVLLRQQDKRLVLKSPPHAGRLETLARLFPDLKVVHVVRDPRAVVPSMIRTAEQLGRLTLLSRRPVATPVAQLLGSYATLFERFEAGRRSVPPGNLVEVRYEDLVTDPVATLREVYARLDLGDFAPLEQALAAQVAAGRFRPPAKPQLSAAQQAAIEQATAPVMQRYGYR